MLSSVGAQDLDRSGYQVSDLEDIEFHCEDRDFNMKAVFRPSIDTPFSPSTFNDFEMGSVVENPVLAGEEEVKENFPPPHPTTPVSKRPTHPLVMMRSGPSGTRIKNVPNCVYGTLLICMSNFYYFHCLCRFLKTIIKVFQIIIIVFKNQSSNCQSKGVLVFLSFILLVAAKLCIYQYHTDKKTTKNGEA